MAWIGLAGAWQGADARPSGPAPMALGTILLETRVPAAPMATLLRHMLRDPVPAGLVLRLCPAGLDVLLSRDGQAVAHHLPLPPLRQGETLRMAFNWDGTVGALSAWLPDRGLFRAVPAIGPSPPVSPHARSDDHADHRNGLLWAALTDRWMPAGPPPLLPGDAPVATPAGPRPLASLRRGDAALGPDGRPVPILHRCRADWPALGGLAPVRLAAPRFGLNQDLIVGAEQALVMRGSAVEYLFGAESVAVPAGLIGSPVAGPAVRYWHGVFTADGAPILVAGAAMATLDARAVLHGRVEQALSPLSGMPLPPLPAARPAPRRLTALDAAALLQEREQAA